MAQKAAESMPRRMAGVKWRPRIASGGMLLRIRAVIVAFAVLWWDSGRRDPAKVEAFPVVRLHDTSQWNRLYRVTSSERTSKGGGVDYATTPLLWAASKGGAASGRGQKRSSTKSGGGFGKVATRPVTDKQQESGRGRSTASTTAGGERGEARRSQSTDGSATSPAQLDKWGLPPPTLDDIFPPLPDGTQLVPVVFNTNYTLEQMQAAVRDVVRLDLDRHFDGLGVERDSASRSQAGQHGKPMKLRLLHQSPPVLAIDNFFTPEECEATRQIVDESKTQPTSTATDSGPPTVQVSSKTFEGAISRRTSTSWFCHYRQHPVLLAKAVHLLGLELPHMEEPQIVRYQPGQEFSFHYDQVPAHQTGNGGQRLATLLVYLNTVPTSGGTQFRDLKGPDGNPLTVRPVQGSALLFFPADQSGVPDDRTLHCGEPLAEGEEKWIVQMWIHQHGYRASVPPHNRQEDALDSIEATARQLGLVP